MKLVFGLGNPGKEYENSIHNAGFLALDRLSRLLSFTDFNRHKGALVSEGRVGAEKVLLVKPQTFMNLSGKCVLELAAFYKVEETDIIVLYDDVDLDLGAVRIRARGSAGTHNGMRSIIGEISTQNFPRIRIGAGRPPKGWDLADYVLSKPKDDAQKAFLEGVGKGAEAAALLLKEGLTAAQQAYNNKGHLKKEETQQEPHES